MARKEIFAKGEFYHLFNRGIEKRIIFNDDIDKFRFQKLLFLCNSYIPLHYSNLKDKIKSNEIFKLDRSSRLVAIGAYCLMNNHFHILVRNLTENGVSKFMQKLSTAYTMYFNIRNERNGSLLQGVFKAKHATDDNYLKYLFSYIHLNPIKHIEPEWREKGIQNRQKIKNYLQNYNFSSLPDYLGSKRDAMAILSQEDYPEYFNSLKSVEDELLDWINIASPVRDDEYQYQG